MNESALSIGAVNVDDVKTEVTRSNRRILSTAKTNEWSSDTRECYNDTHFAKIRSTLHISEDWLDWIDYDELKDGGGKGGDLMCMSPDQRYIIKEMNSHDHLSLLELAESYVNHLLEGPSLLCIILVHFKETTRKKNYFIMTNALSSRPSPWIARYDLKGCQDDKALEIEGNRVREVHKRIWKLHMWCGKCFWSEERSLYFNNKKAARNIKLSVCPEDRFKILEALDRDIPFLKHHGLMDYSMLVGIKQEDQITSRRDLGLEGGGTFRNYTCRKSVLLEFRNRKFLTALPNDPEDRTLILYIGIIDFLQRWNAKKKVARCIKVLERNKPTVPPKRYGDRFQRHFHRTLVGNGIRPKAPVPAVQMDRPHRTNIVKDQSASAGSNDDSGVDDGDAVSGSRNGAHDSAWSGWSVGAEHEARSVNVPESMPDESTTATESPEKI